MERVSREIVRHAQQLAREVDARAVVVYADAVADDTELSRLVRAGDFPTILVTRPRTEAPPPGFESECVKESGADRNREDTVRRP
jgi:hypothetical protein